MCIRDSVNDVVQASYAGELPDEQRDNVADGRELPDIQLKLPGEFADQALGNPLDKLPRRGVNCLRWLLGCLPLVTVDDVPFFLVFHEPVDYRLDGQEASTFQTLWDVSVSHIFHVRSREMFRGM